jgi:pimeloyl-ACP methyl ester carboxylesterase
MAEPDETGYVQVNGLRMYWESRGAGGTPLVVVHGGFGLASMSEPLLSHLAMDRRVIAFELQGHGHTRDIDRPFSYQAFGHDIAGATEQLGLGPVDLLGYSLGAGASLRAALQHPAAVRRLTLVSFPFRRDGWFPEVQAGMEAMSRAGFEQMRHSPMYEAWRAVAPDVDAFPALMDRTGMLLRMPYDWSAEVRGLRMPTMLVFGDADSIPPAHAAEFFALLGGGLNDSGWDGSLPTDMRLAIIPGASHYTIFDRPELAGIVATFTG